MRRTIRRLTFVSDAPHSGGAERYIVAMSRAARERGIEPHVYWCRLPGGDAGVFEAAGGSALLLKADGGQLPLTWLVDGRPVGRSVYRREYLWRPEAGGFVAIAVVDAAGRADRVRVRLVAQ